MINLHRKKAWTTIEFRMTSPRLSENSPFSYHDAINFLQVCPNLLEINKAVALKGES